MATPADKPSARMGSKVADTFSSSPAAAASSRQESQFTIRHVLACFFVVAVCLAPLRAGLAALIFFSAPGVILGVDLVLRGRIWRPRVKTRFVAWLLSGSVAVGAVFGISACLTNGMPVTTDAWCLVVGNVLWCIICVTKFRPLAAIVGVLICIAFQFHLVTPLLPFKPVEYFDITTVRQTYAPFKGVIFARPTKNTRIILYYVNDVRPYWVDVPFRNSEIFWTCSILRRHDLDKYLAILPSDDARRHALRSLTDRENLLRCHQQLVLIAIRALGYPRNEDAAQWWMKNSHVFDSCHDPAEAVLAARGWREEIEKRLLNTSNKRFVDPTVEVALCYFAVVEAVEFGSGPYPYNTFGKSARVEPLWTKPLERDERFLVWP